MNNEIHLKAIALTGRLPAMRRIVLRQLFVVITCGVPLFVIAASNDGGCGATLASSQAAFARNDVGVGNSLPPDPLFAEPASDGCLISRDRWAALSAAPSQLIDTRSRASQIQRAIPFTVAMPTSALVHSNIAKTQRVLLIGEGADLSQELAACRRLADQGHRDIYVLAGGERSWLSQSDSLVPPSQKQLFRSDPTSLSRLDLSAAAKRFSDPSVQVLDWRAITPRDVLQPWPLLPDGIQSRLLLVPNEARAVQLSSVLEALPENTWWVVATSDQLDYLLERSQAVAAGMNAPLNRPCGVQ